MAAVAVHHVADLLHRAPAHGGAAEELVAHLVDRHLGPDHDAVAVRQLERERVHRVVRARHVGAEVAQQVEVGADVVGAQRGAAHRVLLVQARAAQRQVPAVQQHPALLVALDAADARPLRVALHDLAVERHLRARPCRGAGRRGSRAAATRCRRCRGTDGSRAPPIVVGVKLIRLPADRGGHLGAGGHALHVRHHGAHVDARVARRGSPGAVARRRSRSRTCRPAAGRPRAGCRRSSTSRPRTCRRRARRAAGSPPRCGGCRRARRAGSCPCARPWPRARTAGSRPCGGPAGGR